MSNRHALSILLCPPFALKRRSDGVGILTYYPSPAPLGLGLGPTNPMPINVA